MGETVERRMAEMTTSNEMQVEGYAAVFNQETILYESPDTGWKYLERVDPKAFEGSDMTNTVLNYNHGKVGTILARASNGTLRIKADEKGLRIDADIIDTTTGTDVYKLVKRGDLKEMSFAFVVDEDEEIRDTTNKLYCRVIKRIKKLYDVSIVDFPAYEGTAINARAKGIDIEKFEEIVKKEERAPAEQRKRIFILTNM
ncbi:HK97 family phage prohead protease [Veillonella ratti]|uniref:HK97 family phage prohead protease n=1 Tax=Veillonella ratti TaxID=103892 RepID=UPI0013E02610|nr:HK97 family phage prohead protease [Veillonella ratti]